MIGKQKDALVKASEMGNVAETIKKLEDTHEREKRESSSKFEEYKRDVKNKES